MRPVSRFVPSPEFPHGLAAVGSQLAGANSISAAVAFVTHGGVDLLARMLGVQRVPDIELVARGGPITDPTALVRLRDELGIDVSVVMGAHAPRFHPKLWLVRHDDRLTVIAGSGNLTQGGLLDNHEQFDIARYEPTGGAAEAQEQRFLELTVHRIPLDEVQGGAAWREWEGQLRRRRQLEAELRTMDRRLASRNIVRTRTADLLRLSDDLDDLYERTVAAGLPRRDGQRYVPNRFKQAIDRARAAGNPVPTVANICRRRSEGFDVILAADRPDLTAESLVAYEDVPYHDLFDAETLRLSLERLQLFPAWRQGWRPGERLVR